MLYQNKLLLITTAHCSTTNFSSSNEKLYSTVLLSTAVYTVLDSLNNPHEFRVLLDSGSQSNFITADCLKIGLPKDRLDFNV